jgi:hypothetical protein
MNPIVEVDGYVINLVCLIHAEPGTTIIQQDSKEILKEATKKTLWLSFTNGDRIMVEGDDTIKKILEEIHLRASML